MNYETDGELHVLTLTKDEMISLVGILYEGLESTKLRYGNGDAVAETKVSDRETFMQGFQRMVLSADPKRNFAKNNSL